jgi:hypothetical protein
MYREVSEYEEEPTDGYTSPSLFFWDEETNGYHNIRSPTPYISDYYQYNPATENFEEYTGPL